MSFLFTIWPPESPLAWNRKCESISNQNFWPQLFRLFCIRPICFPEKIYSTDEPDVTFFLIFTTKRTNETLAFSEKRRTPLLIFEINVKNCDSRCKMLEQIRNHLFLTLNSFSIHDLVMFCLLKSRIDYQPNVEPNMFWIEKVSEISEVFGETSFKRDVAVYNHAGITFL